MSTGKFVQMGTKMGTTYPEKGDAMWDLVDDFYKGMYSIAKSAGAATYGDNGYFNAIMGKEITAAMFSSDNTFTALGARPYNHEGVRIALELATYGLDAAGNFQGIGYDTIQDGNVPESVEMPVNEYRQPYKELPFSFDYGLGLQAIENKDDTIQYRDYIEKMSANYSDYINRTLLRPIRDKQPTKNGIETSLNGISRCISSYPRSATGIRQRLRSSPRNRPEQYYQRVLPVHHPWCRRAPGRGYSHWYDRYRAQAIACSVSPSW